MSEKSGTNPPDPEMRFVLLCLQGRFETRAIENARVLSSQDGFNWGVVRKIAERERLSPLLYTVTQDAAWLPVKLAEAFRKSYLDCAIHNAAQLRQLAELIEEFAQQELGLIVLKGAALAETIYGNIALRPMTDIDVLVRDDQVPLALEILQPMGYMPVDTEPRPGVITTFENEILLYRQGKINAALELHWSLLDSPHYQKKLGMEWFWSTSIAAQIGYTNSRVLGDEALLLHLCAHLALHHGGWGLLWLHDIAELLVHSRQTLCWETVSKKAASFDLVIPLKQVIPLVNEAWQLGLDDEALDNLSALQPSEREKQVHTWLTATDRPVGQRFLVDLATSSGWKDRFAYAWHSLFPTAAYMRQRYDIKQGYLLPFYYPYRWLLGLVSLMRR